MASLISCSNAVQPSRANTETVESWSQFLGNDSKNKSDSKNIPLKFSDKENVTWKQAIPGSGYSSPVIYGDKIWLTLSLNEGHQRRLMAFHIKTGKKLHDIKLMDVKDPDTIHKTNTHASATPCIDDQHIYISFGNEGVFCVDINTAKIVWKRFDLNIDHGMGNGSSVTQYKQSLIMNFDGMDHQFVIALNKKDGKTKWKTKRSADFTKVINDQRKSYSTPVVYQVKGKDELISMGSYALYSYDPNNGEENWRLDISFICYSIATVPRQVDGHFIITTGFNRSQLLKVKDDGSKIVWSYKKSVPKLMSPQIVDGKIYFGSASYFLRSVTLKDGKEVWKQRMKGGFYASPLYVGKHIYFFADNGHCYVIKPGNKYNEVADNQLDSGVKASPIIADNAMFVRSFKSLYRIEKK